MTKLHHGSSQSESIKVHTTVDKSRSQEYLSGRDSNVDHVEVLLEPMADKGAASVHKVAQLQVGLLMRRQVPACKAAEFTARPWRKLLGDPSQAERWKHPPKLS